MNESRCGRLREYDDANLLEVGITLPFRGHEEVKCGEHHEQVFNPK
ncbi:MAG: hypothetical protein QXO43_08275 [Metallosphaera sp.]